jgi:Ca2+/H+ antiporter
MRSLFKIRRERQVHPLTDGPAPPSERVFPRPRWVPSIADTDSTNSSVTAPSRFSRMRRFSRSHPEPDPETATIDSVDSDDEEEVPLVKFWFAAGMLLVVTAIAGVTAEWLLDSIDGLTATGHVSREFVGLILLPVIGACSSLISSCADTATR